jgi:hypothetical protein
MNAETIIREAQADGVALALTPTGTIKTAGKPEAVDRWRETLREHKAELIDALTAKHWLWRISFSDHDRPAKIVSFSPEASYAEVMADYPDAIRAEPMAPPTTSPGAPMSRDEETGILGWLDRIGEHDQTTRAEVMVACRQDEDAKNYFVNRWLTTV